MAYGSIGGVIVLMLRLHLSGTEILLDGEINAELEAAAQAHARQGPASRQDER